MRQIIVKLLLIALIFCMFMFPTHVMGQRVFVYGKIITHTGAPAMGVEVRLVKNGAIIRRTYTNQVGKYGFFDIPGVPSQYQLVIPQLHRSVSLRNIRLGGRVRDIRF